jgi:hypothetical protein
MELLVEIGFAWKAVTPLQPTLLPQMQELSSSDHSTLGQTIFLILLLFLLCLCRIWIRKRPPAVWVQGQNQHQAAIETNLNVHLPTESNQGPALLNLDKLQLGQTKEATLQAVALVLWRHVVVLMKKIQTHLS